MCEARAQGRVEVQVLDLFAAACLFTGGPEDQQEFNKGDSRELLFLL